MTVKSKIQVLLSTYNGELFIAEQLESILLQEGVDFSILVRDDGSQDRTTEIVAKYVGLYPDKIRLLKSDNRKLPASFFELIRQSSEDYDYYAFCDQDDVWEPGKLLRAVTKLKTLLDQERPLLYCSATTMVDQELNVISVWPQVPRRPLTVYNALIENVVVGCTAVFNKRAMDLMKHRLPTSYDKIIMHDWWLYATVAAFGEVIFDPEPAIRYRQHDRNSFGGSTSHLSKWKKRLRRFFSTQYTISDQAAEFLKCYNEEMSSQLRSDIEHFVASQRLPLLARIRYAQRFPFYRHSVVDQLVFRLICALGKL